MREIELLIDETGEWIDRISLVDEPAIEKDFIAFAKEHQIFSADEEKHIITGAVMIPEKRMYREDEKGGYYVYFSEDTIREAAYRWLKENKNHKFNLDHSTDTNAVSVIESWIVEDPDNDKSSAMGFKSIPKGTWFISAKVEDETIWEAIKNGTFNGFSIEGMFHFEDPVIEEAEEFLKEFEKNRESYTNK